MKITNSVAIKFIFTLTCLFLSNAGWAGSDIPREPVPDWVAPIALPEVNGFPQDQVQNGIYYLLIDSQVLAEQGQDPQYYTHNADYIVNQTGVEENSQINIGYYPDYQRLALHSLRVIRDGQSIDKIDSARMNLIQREEEMDELIYNGRMTLNIILDDVRVGDIIEYSYSRQGMNPVYQNIFSYSHYLNWSVPVGRVSLRLLWNKPLPLQHLLENSDLELTHTKTANGSEYLIQGDRIEPVKIDDNTPSWFTPWGMVFFSELNSWGEVASWSEKLYHDTVVADEDIKRLVADIRSQHKETDAQISAALRFVQDEIRYLGIELGHNSHKPTPAFETLRNRYGDCKDKTVLLLTVLKGLGVEAYPALVNTEKKLDGVLPDIRAFDHVITYIEHEGKHYWVDPTRSYQYGGIDTIHQPDYGQALVLRPGSSELTPMAPLQPSYGSYVKDRFVLHADDDVEFSSASRYYGWNAERQRQRLADSGRAQLQREYLEFFQRYYPGTAVQEPIEYTDNTRDNAFFTTEHYRINNFWEDKPDKRRHVANFYANIVSSSLAIPDEPTRVHPLGLTHPERVEQVIELNFEEDDWNFEDEHFVEDNDIFSFSSDVKFDKAERRLTLAYTYKSKTDHVSPENYQDYLTALKTVDNLQSYSIYKNYPEDAVAGEPDPWFLTYLNPTTVLAAYAGLYLLVILLWRIDRRRNPDNPDAVFFPVSIPKLAAMWILTFGVYGMYWFYRNFKYIKEQEGNATMPVARGIFNTFWYYPLWIKVKEDSDRRFEHPQLPGKKWAAALALAFFAAGVAENSETLALPSLLFGVLLVLPLANYILFVNHKGAPAVAKNSRWSSRHYLLALLSVPLLALSAGSEVGFLPNDAVVKGSRLMAHDVKLMQRRGIIKPGDDIDYFYSDAFLFVSDDGNGFTQRHVFSYWKDEKDSLLQQQATYGEIKDVQVDWNQGFGNNTTVTIVREDDSEFLLYVSNTDHKDRLFVNALKERWQHHRQ